MAGVIALALLSAVIPSTVGAAEPDESVAVELRELASSQCSGRFVARDLEHVTRPATTDVSALDSMGSGVAIADLDGDGRLDFVLANLSGAAQVFWNRGHLRFKRTTLAKGRFRQVGAVDEDADGHTDIVLSTGVGHPLLFRNAGGSVKRSARFERTSLADVSAMAYAFAWGDLGGDGELDLVTGSYNAELTADPEFSQLIPGRHGVVLYRRDGDGYASSVLTEQAQTLVVLLEDIDADGSVDILVGNDFVTPDGIWMESGGLYQPAAPFSQTTFSTMSLDAADYDNDGDADVFATDMHPMSDDPETLAVWDRAVGSVEALPQPSGDIQITENVLQVADDGFTNEASSSGVDRTGWSWSGVFGDLDNDGLLDLYVVNGMKGKYLFPDLAGHELVEPNQAFRNVGGGRMAAAPDWNLAATEGGRGMAMADLDGDGDLDIVINNLGSHSRVFENQVCGGSGVTVDLRWEGTGNANALGAVVEATADGDQLRRTVREARGYLSSGPTRVHFGTGSATVASLRVTWPDGVTTDIGSVPTNHHVRITRSAGNRDSGPPQAP